MPRFGTLADQAAFGIFERFGAEPLYDRNRVLVRHLHARLRARGLDAADPEDVVRSTIVSFSVPNPMPCSGASRRQT